MKNLKDPKTKIFPSKTRGGKELPSSSALDSPSVISKLATPPHAINSDMSQVIDDATCRWKRHLWDHEDPFYGWRARGCAKSGSDRKHTDRLPRFGPRRCVIP